MSRFAPMSYHPGDKLRVNVASDPYNDPPVCIDATYLRPSPETAPGCHRMVVRVDGGPFNWPAHVGKELIVGNDVHARRVE